MLEDEGSLEVGDFGERCETAHGYFAKVLGIAYDDMDQVIVGSGDVVYANDFGNTGYIPPEGFDLLCAVAAKPDCDHGLDSNAEDCGLQGGMEPREDPTLLKTSDPF